MSVTVAQLRNALSLLPQDMVVTIEDGIYLTDLKSVKPFLSVVVKVSTVEGDYKVYHGDISEQFKKYLYEMMGAVEETVLVIR